MPKFRFLPEVSPSGIAFEAFGKTERQLLENAALALEEAMVETKTVKRRAKELVNMRSTTFQDLVFRFLEHLIFLKSAKGLLFCEVKLGFERQGKSFVVQGFAYGERADAGRHKLRSNVRAPSKHLFEVGKAKNGFRAQVILEI